MQNKVDLTVPNVALNSFRELYENQHATEVASSFLCEILTKAPTGVELLFDQFLSDPRTTKDDIKHLLIFLCNTDKGEWDEIAHMFL